MLAHCRPMVGTHWPVGLPRPQTFAAKVRVHYEGAECIEPTD